MIEEQLIRLFFLLVYLQRFQIFIDILKYSQIGQYWRRVSESASRVVKNVYQTFFVCVSAWLQTSLKRRPLLFDSSSFCVQQKTTLFLKSCFSLEASIGIEPMNQSFADSCLTAWLTRHISVWSRQRESDPRLNLGKVSFYH